MTLHHVADLDQLEEAKAKIGPVSGRSIGIIKANDKIYSLRNVCPHKGSPICRGQVRGTMLLSGPATFIFGLEKQVLQYGKCHAQSISCPPNIMPSRR